MGIGGRIPSFPDRSGLLAASTFLTLCKMKHARVLVVEDEAVSASLLQRMLTAGGFEVVGVCQTGERAIEQARLQAPEVVLMDIQLEGAMDGVETATEIQRLCGAAIVYVSGHSDDATLDRAARTGSSGYLIKPFDKRELWAAIQMAAYKNQVDRDLRARELQLSTILASIPGAVVRTSPDHSVDYMNAAAELLLSQSNESAKGRKVYELLQLCQVETGESVDDLRRLLEFGSSARSTKTFQINSDGNGRRIVNLTLSRVANEAGEYAGHVIVLWDVTSQYEAEQGQRTLAAALEGMEDAVLISEGGFNGEWPRIVYVNQSFERVAGWKPNEAVGKPVDFLRCEEDANTPDFWRDMRAALSKGAPFHGEVVLTGKDGRQFHAQWTANAVLGATGHAQQFVFSLRDVTHVRSLEESIRQSQKIEAVGRLAGGIAHDFNNLLSVINSYSDLQLMKLPSDSPALKYAQQIRAAGQKGSELVAQLMTFSRRDRPSPTALRISEVVDEVQGMLRRVIREDIDLETSVQDKLPTIRADQGQIEQVLLNLCVNARDAMPNGGCITIDARERVVEKPYKRGKEIIRTGRFVVLSVRDTGAGMDAATQERIFDPYFTTKEAGKGTGLGLATVYGIMKQAGGYITVESAKGKGACFELLFPVYEGQSEPVVLQEDTTEAPQGSSETVLVVEDDETFLDCISGLLSLHGYDVYTASDGAQALEHMERMNYDFRLLVSDLVLPRMSGREVAARLLENAPSAKVIFMTGYDDQLDTFYSLPGDSVILEKPFPLNTLLIKAREVLEGQPLS